MRKYALLALLLVCQPVAAHSPLLFCYELQEKSTLKTSLGVGLEQIFEFQTRVVSDALDSLAMPYQLQRLPWRRCLAAVSRGELDGAIGVGWTAERDSAYHFPRSQLELDPSKRLLHLNYSIYTRYDSPLQWDGQQLTGIQHGLAAPKGYVAEQRLQQLGVWRELDTALDSGIDLVLKHRLDGYVLPDEVAAAQLKGHSEADKIRKLEPRFMAQPLYLVLSRKSSKLDGERRAQLWQQIELSREKLLGQHSQQSTPEQH